MKSLRIITLLVIALALAPTLLASGFGLRAGHYNDADEDFVGAEVLFDLGAINLNPNIEYSLADDVTQGTANVDLLYDVTNIGRITPYIGAGIGLAYLDNDLSDNRTDVLGNLIGGVAFKFNSLQPYAQVKYFRILDNDGGDADDDLALTIGLRF
jgi:opacity protein-like surface antigen